jgi:hypothetical protein
MRVIKRPSFTVLELGDFDGIHMWLGWRKTRKMYRILMENTVGKNKPFGRSVTA